MQISLVLTTKCTAACGHCSTSCGPRRTEALDREEILRWMSEAAAIDDGEELCFDFTGGEPFIDFEGLLAVFRHGKSLGGRVSCVTNAFWARSPEIAEARLRQARDAGLNSLSVSISRFHLDYVPMRSVRNALEAATRIGLITELKGVVTNRDVGPGGLLEQWQSELDADVIHIFPVIPCLRDGETLPEDEYYRKPGLPEDKCPGEIVCVEPDGSAMSCCGQAPSSRFLEIGNAREEPLTVIHQRFRDATRQRLLREQGPIAFARAARAAGAAHLLREAYAGPCDLCVHVATQPELRRIADEFTATVKLAPPPVYDRRETKPSNRSDRSVQMKEEQLEKLQDVIARAARDPEFLKTLVEAPVESTPEQAVVESIRRELRRFGGNPNIHPDDALNWAVGVLARCLVIDDRQRWSVQFMNIPQNPSWKVLLLDIPMNDKKSNKKSKKKANWRVVMKDIPRNEKPKHPKKKKSGKKKKGKKK